MQSKLIVLSLALLCDSVLGGGLRKLNAMELASDPLPVVLAKPKPF
jgi:hypothetical protein